jgi:NRPS condensation-like uncharacterized protein
MEFDRRLDPAILEAAAQACLYAHPILHSRLVRGNGPAVWEMVEKIHVPPVIAEECPEDYHPHVTGPVDPYTPPQFRVRLLRRPSGDVIVVNLAHAAADAYGFHTLMAQLLEEYEKPGSIHPAEGGIPARDTLWTRALAQQGTPVQSAMTMIDPMWPDPFGTSPGPVSFHRACIMPREIETIRAHAKSCGGTINDAILAAYFLTMSDLTGFRGPISLFFPVNLRQHLHDGSRVMSNQATNACILLERAEDEGIDEILAHVISGTRKHKVGCIGIPEQVEMDAHSDPEGRNIQAMVEQMAAHQDRGLADIFISNPGVLGLPDCKGLTDAYVCYPGGFMPTTCFITSTFRERMTVTMGYQDGLKTKEGTRRALDLFVHHLRSLGDHGIKS